MEFGYTRSDQRYFPRASLTSENLFTCHRALFIESEFRLCLVVTRVAICRSDTRSFR